MGTRPFPADDSVNAATATEGAQEDVGHVNRHQLNVIAGDMADLVRSSGGWLYDRARAGWDVNVLVDGCRDARPLAILGATPLTMDPDSVCGDAFRGGALAVSAELLETDARLREHVLALLKTGAAEVTVWGECWPEQLGRRIDPAQHRLSVAARAFKAQAMAAAAVPPCEVTDTETHFDLGAEAFRPLYSV